MCRNNGFILEKSISKVLNCIPMKDTEKLFSTLEKSTFRSSFRLGEKEVSYLREKGIGTVMEHAGAFLKERIAPAIIPNDGRQTPVKNHPVFIAQHATGICCRKCIEKWHGIPGGHELTEEESDYQLTVIRIWLSKYL